jgi:hypothetical protein
VIESKSIKDPLHLHRIHDENARSYVEGRDRHLLAFMKETGTHGIRAEQDGDGHLASGPDPIGASNTSDPSSCFCRMMVGSKKWVK